MAICKKLQIYRDGAWQYIFAYHKQFGVIVTTKDKRKALPDKAWHTQSDLTYFKLCCHANEQIRLEP